MVSTPDSESGNPSSNLGGTWSFFPDSNPFVAFISFAYPNQMGLGPILKVFLQFI